jgi:heat-inducible transcriptional repressor
MNREIEILKYIVKEYITSGKPVSSQLLKKKYKLDISPATIRIEMQKLQRKNLICQAYFSSGRIPTEKGYRVFLNYQFKKRNRTFCPFKIAFKPNLGFFYQLVNQLAKLTKTLSLCFLRKEKIILKEGWNEILKNREFQNQRLFLKFSQFVERFEKEIPKIKLNTEIKIYIGKEHPFKNCEEFGSILTTCNFPKIGESTISLLGPKRMDYNKNIELLKSLKNSIFEKSS